MAFVTDVREFQAPLDACSSTREWEIFYLALNIEYINKTHTHTQSGAENSLFQFFLTITKSFPPIYLEEMKVVMRVHKSTVAYNLVDLYNKGAPWHATNNC